MYIREADRAIIMHETPELEGSTCMDCGKTPYILWNPAKWGAILLCGECAQVVATQLMKDVRSYELDTHVAVKVQARLGKRRWQVFRTDRADEGCAFTARYKLRATSDAKRYRFRALVPQAAGYPYERGYSRTVKVKLRRRGR
jgi:hypothetical protein